MDSYAEVQVAGPLDAGDIYYTLEPRDVARFQMYPLGSKRYLNRANERASQADRRSVNVTDPLHRLLYILHPSLVIRAYRGKGYEAVEVADLRRRTEEMFLAGE